MGKERSSGFLDESIDSALKAYISQGDICICYLVPDGFTITQSANWNSPLESANAGAKVGDTLGGVAQYYSGETLRTQLNSALVWDGNMPLSISFQGTLSAKYVVSIYDEVLRGVSETFQIMSTELKRLAGVSKIPQPVTLTIFDNIIFQNCQITENSTKLPMRVHEQAKLPIKAEVDLTLSSRTMLNSSQFAAIFKK